MNSLFNIPIRQGLLGMHIVFVLPWILLLMACAAKPINNSAPDQKANQTQSAALTPSPKPPQRPMPTGLVLTYQNQASKLQVHLDPYDENLHIQMSRSPVTVKATDLESPTAKVPTASTQPPPPATPQIPEVTQGPPVAPNPPVPLSSEPGEPVWEDITDEVLADIRRAQELFYEKNYAMAYRRVQMAQSKRRTAEGHALSGSILFMQGDREGARRHWMEALGLNPNMPEVEEMLRKLDGEP